ncbi:MAG: Flp pilus assembly protein CpaB [Candidatus Acidiferrales bacterium]
MNRKRLVIGILVAMFVSLAASTFVYRQVTRATAVRAGDMTQVVVASSLIPAGTRLQPGQLRTISWPTSGLLPGMFTRVQDCLDRPVTSTLVVGEPLLEDKLAPKESGAGLTATIPQGMRALSVPVNDVVGVAGFVQPGTTVDVLVTGTSSGKNSGESVTRTILEGVRVLAAGQKIEQDRDGKPQSVTVITLLVSPIDANRLAMASTQGRIQLALRSSLDSKRMEPPPIYQATLFAGEPPPAPVTMRTHAHVQPAAPAPYAVEVIRAGKREVNTFPNQ